MKPIMNTPSQDSSPRISEATLSCPDRSVRWRRTLPLSVAAAFAIAGTLARAQAPNLDELPAYQPDPAISGTVKIWGNTGQAQVIANWQEGLGKLNPRIRVEFTSRATSTAIGALYINNTADLALMGREIWHIETQAFVRTFKHKPLGIRITSGTYESRGDTVALGFFVHADNPVTKLNFRQLDAIFGAEHYRGTRNFRKWGDLGLTGEWADKPIHIYGYWLDGGEAEFVRQIVMKNSYVWNSGYRQFWNTDVTPGGATIESAGKFWVTDPIIDGKLIVETGTKITEALSKDPYGISLNGVGYTGAAIKPIAVSEGEDGPYVAPTRETVANRSYPLTRSTYLYLDRPPGQPVKPVVREFLMYALSREGQEGVLREGKAIPLTAAVVAEERLKLQ